MSFKEAVILPLNLIKKCNFDSKKKKKIIIMLKKKVKKKIKKIHK